jgi:hypothetical protein
VIEGLLGGIWIVWLVATIPLLWAAYCNHRTGSDRRDIANRVFKQRNWRELSDQLKLIPYEKHLLYRITFRDPFQLYKGLPW